MIIRMQGVKDVNVSVRQIVTMFFSFEDISDPTTKVVDL